MAFKWQARVSATKIGLDAATINKQIEQILGRKAQSITRDPDLRKRIGQEYVKQVTPYVPVKTEKLRRSGRGTSDGRVTWSAIARRKSGRYKEFDYAYWQFHFGPKKNWTENVQPGTPDWEVFIQRITPIILKRFSGNSEK